MLEIKRFTKILRFQTPIKASCIMELEIYNTKTPDSKSINYINLYSDEHLPLLNVTNLKNEKLRVLQTSMVPEDILQIAKESETVPVYVLLNNDLNPGEYETLKFEFLQTWKEDVVLFTKKYIFRIAQFEEPYNPLRLISKKESSTESSIYFGVFVPEKYSIKNVQVVSPEETGVEPSFTHRDENSFLLRWFPTPPSLEIVWDITVPNRITSWLVIGLLFGFINPIMASFHHFITYNPPTIDNLRLSSSVILTTIGAIIGTRALIFYSEELFDNFNIAYLFLLLWNIELMILCFIITIIF